MTNDQFDKLVAKMHQQSIERDLKRETRRNWKRFLPVYFGLCLLMLMGRCFAGDVTIECTAKAEREDGKPAPVLGVIISYGTTPDLLTKTWKVAKLACTTTITGLTDGTWYFAAKSYTSDETSALSAVISTEIKPAALSVPVIRIPL